MITDFPQTIELIAAILGIICVYLQTKENILAWPFGIASVTILVYVFSMNRLYSDMILHFIYIGLNIYGWWYWATQHDPNEEVPIVSLSPQSFVYWFIGIFIGTMLWGYGMNSFTNADLAYVDAFTTVGSLCAQYLLAKKVLQNWVIWIVVDVIAVNVYVYKGLYFTAIMFLVFLILCIKGYRDWKKTFNVSRSIVEME